VVEDEMVDVVRLHASVVNPGWRLSLNPYFLGYSILVDIEKRWDALHAAGESPLTVRQKLFEVRRTADDISFLRNYLTLDLMEDLDLFAYGRPCTHPPGQRCAQCEHLVITSREHETVLAALLAPRYNYGVPRIVIRDVLNNTLYLEHLDRATTFPDRRLPPQTLPHSAELSKHPLYFLTGDERGREVALTGRPGERYSKESSAPPIT